MDATGYMKIEAIVTVAVMGLVLLMVYIAMAWLKEYARYVHRRTIKVYKLQGGK